MPELPEAEANRQRFAEAGLNRTACPRCGGTIARKTVGGRTSYHCPEHQTGAA